MEGKKEKQRRKVRKKGVAGNTHSRSRTDPGLGGVEPDVGLGLVALHAVAQRIARALDILRFVF
jgi:hypothetical protein